jgi:lipopolysaccharide export system protein LptC
MIACAPGSPEAMASRDNAYSRFIALAKIVLPLAALALLSTLFMFSHDGDPTDSLPLGKEDVERLAREQRINEPNYSGVTSDGTALSISADTARPDLLNPNRGTASTISARLDFPNGAHTDISSVAGMIDTDQDRAVLEGGVHIITSDGYDIVTDSVITALTHTSVTADSTVEVTSPMGDLTAGQMQLDETGGENGGYVLVFKQGVKLIYEPENRGDTR